MENMELMENTMDNVVMDTDTFNDLAENTGSSSNGLLIKVGIAAASFMGGFVVRPLVSKAVKNLKTKRELKKLEKSTKDTILEVDGEEIAEVLDNEE